MSRSTSWLWLALLLAFSPVLASVVPDLGLAPRHAFVVFVGLLLGALLIRQRREPARPGRRAGLGLLLLGLVLELLGLAGETQILARLGLPVAALGLALWRGAPAPLSLSLGFWMVPLPNTLVELTSPGLEAAWARLAAGLWSALGLPLQATGITLEGPLQRLVLRSENGGLLNAHCLAAVGWFLAVWRGGGTARALRGATLGYALGFLLQPPAVLLAGLLVALGQRELARAWLTHGVWLLGCGLWLAWSCRRRAGARSPAPLSSPPARAPMELS
jgi:hypothetical protein